MTTKTCFRCKTEKPVTEFRQRGDGRGLDSYCVSCWREYHRNWEKKNSTKVNAKKREKRRVDPAWARAKQLRSTYGLSYDTYLEMCEAAQGLCECCGKPWKAAHGGHVPDVDHDHVTGHVRGLLCHACNSLIGLANDDPAICEKAASYLRRASLVHTAAGTVDP